MRMKRKNNSNTSQQETEKSPRIDTRPPRQGRQKWSLEPESYPTLSRGQKKTLYVDSLPEEMTEQLREKGYQVTDVKTLPRQDIGEHALAIEAWLQGMSEGTIEPSAERRRNIELEAKVHGLLINRSLRIDAKARIDGDNLEMILNSMSSNAVTISKVTPERLKRAEEASLTPGIKLDDEEIH